MAGAASKESTTLSIAGRMTAANRRESVTIFIEPRLVKEHADLEPERALAIPAVSLAHLVTGRRNTLGQ